MKIEYSESRQIFLIPENTSEQSLILLFAKKAKENNLKNISIQDSDWKEINVFEVLPNKGGIQHYMWDDISYLAISSELSFDD